MVGYPKYKLGDIVVFKINDNETKTGTVAVVDTYGTFFDDSDVSYDIRNKEEKMLYKHFSEKYIIKKIGESDPSKVWDWYENGY